MSLKGALQLKQKDWKGLNFMCAEMLKDKNCDCLLPDITTGQKASGSFLSELTSCLALR